MNALDRDRAGESPDGSPQARDQRGTILVVDDSRMNCDVMAELLEAQGHAFDIAENGRHALAMMRARPFDLVLLDLMMPEMDGYEVLAEMKADAGLRHIPVIMISSLDDIDNVVRCIERGAEDYLPRPPDPVLLNARLGACLEKKRLRDLEIAQQKKLNDLNAELEMRNRFIQQTFGRYLSDEIVRNILETPGGLNLGGEKRTVTILMTDLRGFTTIGEKLPPEDVVGMINIYLEVMTETILRYHGTIDEFIGDAILVIFGAPVLRDDDAPRAVACAVEMQLKMEEVNRKNQEAGYPAVFMGIGINTGNVVVGNIGSKKRAKYGIVGRAVNLTSRIESYTVGGQILASQATVDACGSLLRVDAKMEVLPKGLPRPITIHDVGGVGGAFNLFLPEKHRTELAPLARPIPIRFTILDGTNVGDTSHGGSIHRLSGMEAEIHAEVISDKMSNLRITLTDSLDIPTGSDLYAKVTENISASPPVFRVNLTSAAVQVELFLRAAAASPAP